MYWGIFNNDNNDGTFDVLSVSLKWYFPMVLSVSLKRKIGRSLGVPLFGKTKLEFRPKMPFHAFSHEQIISAMV